MKEYFNIDIAGMQADLPIVPLPSGIKIAFLNLHGNPVLTEHCGKKIAELLKGLNIDILLTAETKGLQLTHVVARELGHEFYCTARKSKKIHMDSYISAEVKAITGQNSYTLYLWGEESKKLRGKRVAIVDDVISSGGSLKGLTLLINQSGGQLVTAACVLAEGESIPNKDVRRLADLPLL